MCPHMPSRSPAGHHFILYLFHPPACDWTKAIGQHQLHMTASSPPLSIKSSLRVTIANFLEKKYNLMLEKSINFKPFKTSFLSFLKTQVDYISQSSFLEYVAKWLGSSQWRLNRNDGHHSLIWILKHPMGG